MEDRYAKPAVFVDVRVEGYRRLKGQGRWEVGIFWGEAEDAAEVATYDTNQW